MRGPGTAGTTAHSPEQGALSSAPERAGREGLLHDWLPGRNWPALLFFALLAAPALLARRPELSAALAAPLSAALLVSLLKRHDTAASARDWALWIAWGLWALCGAVSLGLLDTPAAPWTAVVLLLGVLAGYNAARRAVTVQKRPRSWAHYAGIIVAVLGASMLADPGETLVYVFCSIVGLLLFYATEQLLPLSSGDAPRRAQVADALLIVQHQLVCVAPVFMLVEYFYR